MSCRPSTTTIKRGVEAGTGGGRRRDARFQTEASQMSKVITVELSFMERGEKKNPGGAGAREDR